MMPRILTFLALLLFIGTEADAQDATKWRADALAIPSIINDDYAYLDHLTDGRYVLTPKMQVEAEAVHDEASLLAFSERALFLLADHHAITGGSFKDSWALVPSYSDIWVERQSGQYVITAVRDGSAAQAAGILHGARLMSVGGQPTAQAVTSFWADLGVQQFTDEQASYAARTLVAGRRDRPRKLGLRNPEGNDSSLTLPSRYDIKHGSVPVTVLQDGNAAHIILNDSLGDADTIAAFDNAMAHQRPNYPLVIDLRNTGSGGNTSVARAIMSWFVTKPTSYQMHQSPAEERQTGIARQWIEQVLPRPGKYHNGPVTVLVGRWTGSMGEGLAIGMKAVGTKVQGDPMAHLLGAVEDIRLPNSGLVIKLPTERLYSVDGEPRENFIPDPVSGKIAGHR
jgi:C-terminal processing protease CtpA/Prc